jgi:rRNA maturation endonuclease Nob1
MAIDDSVTDVLLGQRREQIREYRCDTCKTSFTTPLAPDLASCPGCGPHTVREQ